MSVKGFRSVNRAGKKHLAYKYKWCHSIGSEERWTKTRERKLIFEPAEHSFGPT